LLFVFGPESNIRRTLESQCFKWGLLVVIVLQQKTDADHLYKNKKIRESFQDLFKPS
jgi:hypothetical protein